MFNDYLSKANKLLELAPYSCNEGEKSYVIRKLFENYNKLTSSLAASDPAYAATCKTVLDTLFEPSNIVSYYHEAKTYFQRHEEAIISTYKKSHNRDSFWMSVFSSVVGSLVYSILLALAFYFGKDQIHSWLSSVSKTDMAVQTKQK